MTDEIVSRRSGVPELFDRGLLSRQIRSKASLPEGGVRILHLDTSECSDSPRTDGSALAAVQIIDRPDEQREVWVLDVQSGHWTVKQLKVRICDFLEHWSPYNRATIEKIHGSAWLRELVENVWDGRNVNPYPRLTWNAMQNQQSKVARVNRLIRIHREDRLRIVAGSWNDALMGQMGAWTGQSRNRGRL